MNRRDFCLASIASLAVPGVLRPSGDGELSCLPITVDCIPDCGEMRIVTIDWYVVNFSKRSGICRWHFDGEEWQTTNAVFGDKGAEFHITDDFSVQIPYVEYRA